MRTASTAPLQKARKQVGGVVDQFDLDKRTRDLADKAGVVKRQRRLGVPLGRRRPDWGRIATYGVAAVAAVMGSKALRRDGATSSDAERGAGPDAEAAAPRSDSDTA